MIEEELNKALGKLGERPQEFREQVERLRSFRDQMRQAGAVPPQRQFATPLMERLGAPLALSPVKLTDNA